jgi:hypothetical protein
MASVLRIHADAREPGKLVTGRDLVLDRWAPSDLPDRVLLDDWLSLESREQVDREARSMLDAFVTDYGRHLRFDGLDLVDAWRWELLSEVFLWELRIAAGVDCAISALTPDRIEWHHVDREQREALTTLLGHEGSSRDDEPARPAYPSSLGAGWRASARVRLVRDAGLAFGMPAFVRGNVLLHGDLGTLLSPASTVDSFTPVLNPKSLPGVPVKDLATLARRGGWIGAATPVRLASARRRLRRSLNLIERNAEDSRDEPLRRFLARRATEFLRQLAGTTVADYGVALRALSHGRIRAVALPFDTPAGARALIQAARHSDVPALVLQHGFASVAELMQEGTEGDIAAVWSRSDADLLRPYARGRIAITGNPRAEHLLEAKPITDGRRHTIILAEYPFRMSARIDSRVKHRHVLTALRALEETRPGTAVTIRPHPGDHEPRALEGVAKEVPALHVRVDSSTRFKDLLEGCDLVIAALSTGALEAGARCIPVIFLNSLGIAVSAPFDGSQGLPTAESVDELVGLIPPVLEATEPPGRPGMCEALGMRSDATQAVIHEIERLVADHG